MTENIMIPTNWSDYTGTALEYGIYIAERIDAKLTMLYGEENINEGIQSVLNRADERCRKARLDFQLKRVREVSGELIIEEAKDSDWVFLPQNGEQVRGRRGELFESVLEVVIGKSDNPVLVIPPYFQEIESIGLAYDGSPSADNALMIAAELSDKVRWPLTIITVNDESHWSADLSRRIEELLDPYEEIDSDVVILNGKAKHEIIKFIEEGSIELMVMGLRGNKRLGALTPGSTTSHVIHKSVIPVLIIH